ncbi:signal peptidase [Anaerosolibacter carboniphilus]|uniref:Signal peptidase I n=1 Tax=Anaerosolibacter carboniphilus TaxID=1417629 RepID=A0A841KLM5_9FIRM|nr:signal peptidase I [Anaerosolibacter carboniphilus]MBB6214347.1 signal peptidase [Anaerosolibacter carboniphilus]
MIRSVLRWGGNILTVLLVIFITFSIFAMFHAKKNPNNVPSIMGYKPLTVLTGSMQPILDPGDMIVIREKDPNDVKAGDIITYRIDQDTLVTHRVVAVIDEAGGLSFRTKGDANNTEDQDLVPKERLVGALAFNIPKGGAIADFAKTGKGFILFVLVPIFLLIALELKTIWTELSKGKKDSSQPKDPMGV